MEKCVFFCDDDTDILDICRIILESEGIKVITCSTAETLQHYLTKHIPHLIFIDNGLAGIAGHELISHIKGNEQYKSIPVVLFSANAEIESIAQTSSADGWLAKPLDIKDLKTTVRNYLN